MLYAISQIKVNSNIKSYEDAINNIQFIADEDIEIYCFSKEQAENYLLKKYGTLNYFANSSVVVYRQIDFLKTTMIEKNKILLPTCNEFKKLSINEQVDCVNTLANIYDFFDQIAIDDNNLVIDLSSHIEIEESLYDYLLNLSDVLNEK